MWRYCLLGWGGNICQCEKDGLNRLIRRASRMIGIEQTGVGDTYQALLPYQLQTVWTDVSHSLHDLPADQLIVLNGRLRLSCFGTKTQYPSSFVPQAISCHKRGFESWLYFSAFVFL